MTIPADDQSDTYEEALEIYNEYVQENIGLRLKKRPSEKQKTAIVDLILRSHEEEAFDLDVILEQHARNCLEPLYLTDKRLFSRVENILGAFLPESHPQSQKLALNDEEPPVDIGQLLKRPTIEQLAEVVKALEKHDPEWCWYDRSSGGRMLVLVLGNNFPELIKQNSRTRIIFGKLSQDSVNSRLPPLTKSKKKNRATFLVLALVLLSFWVFNLFRSSTQSDKMPADNVAQSQPIESPKQGDIAQEPPPITTLENVVLPITLVSTKEFLLLDRTGKQTAIPVGSIIKVESRRESGTLTTHIKGELFVGYEERLAGKVREKKD